MKRRDFLAAALTLPWLTPAWQTLALERPLPDTFALYGSLAPDGVFKRVLAAGPPAAVLLYCLAPQALLGWPFTLSPSAQAALAPEWRQLPHLGRLAGRGSTLSLETLLALKPDVIIDTGTLNDLYRSGAQRTNQQTGISYLVIDGDILQAGQTFRTLGPLLGVEERGRQLAAQAQAILDAAHALAQRRQTNRDAPTFYMARGADGLETAPAGSLHAQAPELCGMRNVVPAISGSGLARISPEQLLLWDPDFIFTHDPILHEMASHSPRWAHLRAVRGRRLILAPAEPFGWLDMPPGMNRLLGLHWLTQAGQPEASSAALRQVIEAFFRLFYQTPPSRPLLDTALRLLP